MGDRAGDNDDTVLRARAAPGAGRTAEPDLVDTIIRLVEPAIPLPTGAGALAAARSTGPTDLALVTTPVQRWAMRVRGTSPIVPLDVPAVIGRRPGPARPTENPAPRRIVIPTDRGDVSARHVRIEQLGETLVVADLGSTNGTVVHWSTGSNLRLRAGESCAVLPDAVIVLGDGVEIEFVAIQFVASEALTPTIPITTRPSEAS